MATPHISLLLDVPRTESLQAGWSRSKLAASLQPARYDDGSFTSLGGGTAPGFVPQKLDDLLIREPNVGVIFMMPGPMHAAFWEDPFWENARIHIEEMYHDPRQRFIQANKNKLAMAQRASVGAAIIGIDDLVPVAIRTLFDLYIDQMSWVLESMVFAENEGFAVWVYPPGTVTDRAKTFMVINFGSYFALHLKMNGTASLWTRSRTPDATDWKERTSFNYEAGGVQHGKPFQITVVPWGFNYISFFFSQASMPQQHIRADLSSKSTTVFLYDIGAVENIKPRWDSTNKQYIKTFSAPLRVGLRNYLHQYGFAFARVTYPDSVQVQFMPEFLPETQDATPVLSGRGFQGQKLGAGTGTKLDITYTNENDVLAYDPLNDTGMAPLLTFTSDSSHKYTPEIWSLDFDVAEKTFVPDWTPRDISDQWSYIRFQRTVEPDQSTAEFKCEVPDSEYPSIFKPGGPCQLQYDGAIIWDGYIDEKQPTLEGPKVINVTQVSARDMWVRLNDMPVADYKFLDTLNLLTVIKSMIKKAGFTEADIEVTDPSGGIASIDFPGFVNPNDQKAINQDGKVGDVLREILDAYSLLPIRVRWTGGKWRIYSAPQFTAGTIPTKRFYLVHPTVVETDLASLRLDDPTRFGASKYLITSNPELTITEPAFNSLIGRAATGTTDGAEGLEAVVPALKIDPRSVQDPSYMGFMGRVKTKIVAPPEIASPQTDRDLIVATRLYWERNHNLKPILEFKGEWQPEMDADDFIWVIGVNSDRSLVSYGAYRIDTINVEGHFDFLDHDMAWSIEGDYTCRYVGKVSTADIPMFTDDAHLPV